MSVDLAAVMADFEHYRRTGANANVVADRVPSLVAEIEELRAARVQDASQIQHQSSALRLLNTVEGRWAA